MIIYIDANGEVLEQEYTEVVQGDNDANNIYLIAPLAQNAAVRISFECPNGYVTDPNSDDYLMTPSIDNMVGGLRMWKLSIKNIPITQYYGIVKYQIKATINGKTIAVARGKFKVQEGVGWELPSTPDENVYADILNQVVAGFINKVDINYNNDDVEQEIINNENGLKLVKTEGETTSVYEFKADGLYQNGVKIVDANELEAIKAEIEAELALLQVDLETVKENLANTKTELNNKIDTVEAELTGQIATVNSDLIEFKETAENQFELIDNTKGTKIVASVDNQTYVMNFELQNSKNETISTSQIDLPLESVVVNGTYADGILTLTLKNGNSVDINIGDIISGLATEQYVDYKISELNNKIDNLPTGGVTEDYVNTQISRAVAYKLERGTMHVGIAEDKWVQEDNDPFAYSAIVQVEGHDASLISYDAIYELINDQPVMFAKYGLALSGVQDYYIQDDVATPEGDPYKRIFEFKFLAAEKPNQDIYLAVEITGTDVDLQEEGIE